MPDASTARHAHYDYGALTSGYVAKGRNIYNYSKAMQTPLAKLYANRVKSTRRLMYNKA